MATSELELYYERKLRIALDALDELDRLELDPKISSQERDRIREMKPSWQREYTLARTQYAGVISAQSALPSPRPIPRPKALSKHWTRSLWTLRKASFSACWAPTAQEKPRSSAFLRAWRVPLQGACWCRGPMCKATTRPHGAS